jgi:hypothetical protein
MQTYKLNNGVHVLARELNDRIGLFPYTFVNRSQAENAARLHGGKVYQGPSTRRVFYVIPSNQES